MTNAKLLWQLVEQWRRDNQPLIKQLKHLQLASDLQRKLHERGTHTSDHTGTHSEAPGRVDPTWCTHCDGATDIELDVSGPGNADPTPRA